jgi:hypothetical protein
MITLAVALLHFVLTTLIGPEPIRTRRNRRI